MSSKSDFEFIPTRLNDLWNYLQKKIFIFHVQFCCCFSFNWLLDYSIPSPVLSLRKLQCKSAILTKISYLNNSLKLRREWKTWKSRQTSKKKKLKRENIWNSTEKKNMIFEKCTHNTNRKLLRFATIYFFFVWGGSQHTQELGRLSTEREREVEVMCEKEEKIMNFFMLPRLCLCAAQFLTLKSNWARSLRALCYYWGCET